MNYRLDLGWPLKLKGKDGGLENISIIKSTTTGCNYPQTDSTLASNYYESLKSSDYTLMFIPIWSCNGI